MRRWPSWMSVAPRIPISPCASSGSTCLTRPRHGVRPFSCAGKEGGALATEAGEGGVRYGLDFAGGYSAGLFIDQRANRARLRELKPKRAAESFRVHVLIFGGGGAGRRGNRERGFIAAVARAGRGKLSAEPVGAGSHVTDLSPTTCWRCCHGSRVAGRSLTPSFSILRRSRGTRRERPFRCSAISTASWVWRWKWPRRGRKFCCR